MVDRNINDLIPAEYNPRYISEEQLSHLKASIQRFDAVEPVLVNMHPDRKNIIISGHQRVRAAQLLEMDTFPCVELNLDKEKERELNIRMNKNTGSWDWDGLANYFDVEELTDWGFTEDELFGNFETEEPEAEEDDYEIPDEIETDIALGDLIEIGEHRLLCGDSTDSDQVAKLMDGDFWYLLTTSPPYNQGNGSGDLLTNGKKSVRLYDDKNADNKTSEEYYKFCVDILNTSYLFKNEEDHTVCWNVSYNAKSRDDYGKIIFSDDNPFSVKETIIWDKGHSINLPQVGIYSRRCEFVFVMSSNEKYRTSQIYNDCRWNIWNISTMNSQTTNGSVEHRAAFPVEFASNTIKDFSLENDIIYDPFLGSGTTMVACHQLNRKCYGCELDPKYCQVIVDRMQKLDPSLEIKVNNEIYKGTPEPV